MNKPNLNILPEDDLGPLDVNGQQIWDVAEEAAFERMEADPEYQASIRRAEEDVAAGRVLPHEEVVARSAERRRCWRLDRGL